ncbi:MAG: nitronate monooxygenase [Tissierellia bacterium]|nr:nitronate monooxygenase [Tissierellia bacterium]
MKINELLGIKYPIIQGGMANTSKSELAAAVSNAGGLGQVATGGFSPDEVREEIRKMKDLTDKPFSVNLVLMHPQIEEIIDVVIEEGVKIITCGAGNPAPYFEKWLDAGLKVIPVVGNIKMAKKVQDLGAIACVFEGAEAGGHIGALNTMAALPAIVNSVDIPVISAGGIYIGKQVLAAEILGAGGVQLGTRLLVGEETPIHDNYKKLLLESKDSDSVVTGYGSGHPVRVIKNKLTDKLLELERKGASSEEFEKYAAGAGPRAAREGDVEWGSVMAGEGLEYLTKIEPVKDIIENILKEYEEAKNSIQ